MKQLVQTPKEQAHESTIDKVRRKKLETLIPERIERDGPQNLSMTPGVPLENLKLSRSPPSSSNSTRTASTSLRKDNVIAHYSHQSRGSRATADRSRRAGGYSQQSLSLTPTKATYKSRNQVAYKCGENTSYKSEDNLPTKPQNQR